MVKDFRYTPTNLSALERTVSPERLAPYRAAAGAEPAAALRLYAWNATISAALYVPLQGVEVTLRNALHQQLAQVYGTTWYTNTATGLTPSETRRISQAVANLTRSGKPTSPDRVLTELSFGFWVSLLGHGPAYEMRLWRKALYKAFPHAKLSRRQAHTPLDRLRTLRNRIAHHEPIFGRHLAADYASMLRVIQWISPETAQWVAHHNTVTQTLAERPAEA